MWVNDDGSSSVVSSSGGSSGGGGSSDKAEECNSNGNRQKDRGDWDNAIFFYTQAIELGYKNKWSSYCNRGRCYEQQGNIDQAIADFNSAIDCFKGKQLNDLLKQELYGNRDRLLSKKQQTASSSSSPSAVELNNQGAEAYNAEDYAKAVELFRKAADMGLKEAQNWLGSCYENGEGVPKDLTKAAEWYRKSAEQGHATAQFNLGYAYQEGLGVPKDKAQAYKWYRKAADQGHEMAQNNLENL